MATELASDADILNRIERFCDRHSMSLSTFGRKSIGDASLVANLRADRSLTLKTANKIVAFMADHAPAAVEQQVAA